MLIRVRQGLKSHLINSIHSNWKWGLVRELSKSVCWDYPARWWVKLLENKSNSKTGFEPAHSLPVLLYWSSRHPWRQIHISVAQRLCLYEETRVILSVCVRLCACGRLHIIVHLITYVHVCICVGECLSRCVCVCNHLCLSVCMCARAGKWFPWWAWQMGREWHSSFSLPPKKHEGGMCVSEQSPCSPLIPLTQAALFLFMCWLLTRTNC